MFVSRCLHCSRDLDRVLILYSRDTVLFTCIVLIVLQLPNIHSHCCFLVRIPTYRHPSTELRFTTRD